MSGSEEEEGEFDWDADGVRVAMDDVREERLALHVRDGDESFLFGDPDTDTIQEEIAARSAEGPFTETFVPTDHGRVKNKDDAESWGVSTAMFDHPNVDVDVGGTPESTDDNVWDSVEADNEWTSGPSEKYEVGDQQIEVRSKIRQAKNEGGKENEEGEEIRQQRTNVARITDGESTTVVAQDAADLSDDEIGTDPSEIDADTIVAGEFNQSALEEAEIEELAETVDTVHAGDIDDAVSETLEDHGVHVVVGEDQELSAGPNGQSTDSTDVTEVEAGTGAAVESEAGARDEQTTDRNVAKQFDQAILATYADGSEADVEPAEAVETIYEEHDEVSTADLSSAAMAAGVDEDEASEVAERATELREAMDEDGIESATEAFDEVEGAREEFVDSLSDVREQRDGEIEADDVVPAAKAAKNEASDRNAAVDRVLLASQASDPETAENLMEGVETVYDTSITEADPDSLKTVANANGLDVGTEEMEELVERRTELRNEIDDEALEQAAGMTEELGPEDEAVRADEIAENIGELHEGDRSVGKSDISSATQAAVLANDQDEETPDVPERVENVSPDAALYAGAMSARFDDADTEKMLGVMNRFSEQKGDDPLSHLDAAAAAGAVADDTTDEERHEAAMDAKRTVEDDRYFDEIDSSEGKRAAFTTGAESAVDESEDVSTEIDANDIREAAGNVLDGSENETEVSSQEFRV